MNILSGLTPLIAWMPGGGEWLVIGSLVLLLFGAKKLPELARGLGLAKKEFQKAAREVAEEVEKDDTKSTPSKNGDSSSKKT